MICIYTKKRTSDFFVIMIQNKPSKFIIEAILPQIIG